MRQSRLFIKTRKESPKDEEAVNAKLLTRAGFIDKLLAGVYTFLPLGLKVLKKIENIIREEMENVGGREILMPVLHPKENWQQTGRWQKFDALYKLKSKDGREMALGPTHEEIIVPLAKKFLNSYKDLPAYFYQIQTKFRDEPRAKSGLLRGREFLMKDLYSFHASQEDLDKFYEKMGEVYQRIFKRCGLNAIPTLASGGTFSKYSHEFQVVSPAGEDVIYLCDKCGTAVNREIIEDEKKCPNCRGKNLKSEKAIEVGNIFKLGVKYSQPFNLGFKDKDGKEKGVIMGCYGIGLGRVMGAIVETHYDKNGIIWPESAAPFAVHLLTLNCESRIMNYGEKIYGGLQKTGIEVLYDDRKDVSPGEKFADADLIGIPYRAVISEKTGKTIEIKKRNEKKTKLVSEKVLCRILAS